MKINKKHFAVIQKKTKIPVPLLKKYSEGKAKLSPKTLTKINKAIKAFKASENYQKARKAGLSAREANSIKNRTGESLKKYLYMRKRGVNLEKAKTESPVITLIEAKKEADEILEYAKIIAKNNGVKLKYVLEGMRKSKRVDAGDWEKYVMKRIADKWIPVRYDKKEKKTVPIQEGKVLNRYKKRVKEGQIDY